MLDRSGFLQYEVANAMLGWAIIVMQVLAVVNLALAGDFIWAGMVVTGIAIAVIPPTISRQLTQMIAWEVLALAAFPVVGLWLGLPIGLISDLSVAALALVIAVELDEYTFIEMTAGFAIIFVVIVSMAVAGLWTIARHVSDVYLGTSFFVSQNALMWDLVAATAVGIGAGIVFELYFRRHSPGHRIPRDRWDGTR